MRSTIALLFVAALTSPGHAQVQFSIDQTLNLSSTTPALYGDYLQLVDVTGDGVRDLLTIDGTSLEVYQHDGVTGFVEISTASLPLPGTLGAVADLDGDGDTDALVRFATGYACLLGDGAGGYTPAGSYLTPDDVGQILVGDFNGDGLTDVATARDTGGIFGGAAETEIDVRLGDGTGNFGATTRSELPVGLNFAVVIDLDENGTDDLMLSGLAQLSFAFFSNGIVTSYANYPAGAGDAPQDIRVADLNNDGHQDAVFTCPAFDRVAVLILDGTGQFGLFQDYTTSGSPVTLRPGDVNADGVSDLLVTTSTGFEWRLGFGDGTFGAPTVLPMSTTAPRFAVGDSTNDGLAEVAVLSGNTVSILLNTTSLPQPGEFLRGDTNLDGSVQITDAVRALEALFVTGSPALECADTGDTNDDGETDLSDAVFLLAYLFVPSSPTPPAPGVNNCGPDPTADALPACGPISSCP